MSNKQIRNIAIIAHVDHGGLAMVPVGDDGDVS